MQLNYLKNVCTLGSIGYASAPGTLASIVTVPLLICLKNSSISFYAIMVMLLCMLAFVTIKKTLHLFKDPDPSEIVIDEVIGTLITFFAIPFTFKWAVLGLYFFRLFDITKMGGVKWFEQFKAPWGIILDDVWAGILSNIILQILLRQGII